MDSLFKSLLPDAAANEFGPICKVFRVIADKIRSEIPPVDISAVMAEVEALLNQIHRRRRLRHAAGLERRIRYIDLSQIDFDALKEQFERAGRAIEVQKLRAKLAVKLAQMVKLNRTRMDFLEEFQKMIDEYNAGSIQRGDVLRQADGVHQEAGRRGQARPRGTTDGRGIGHLRSADEARM